MNSNSPFFKPFEFDKFRKIAAEEHDFVIDDPKKCVIIGDELVTDIMFGNINNLSTI